MTNKVTLRLSVVMLVFLAGASIAQGEYTPAAYAKIIAPYIDTQTIAVARVDITQIDSDACFSKFMEIASKSVEPADINILALEVEKRRLAAQQWIASFTAAGGRDIYVVVSMADFPGMLFCIAPVAPGADTAAMVNQLRIAQPAGSSKGSPIYMDTFEQIGNVIFCGSKAVRQRIAAIKPDPRPELQAAFAAAGDSALQVLVVPDADTRRVIEEMLPVLPELTGSAPGTAVTQGFLWAAIGINTPPKMSLKAYIQSQNSNSAQALSNVIKNIYTFIRNAPGSEELQPELDNIFAMITPVVKDDYLILNLTDERLNKAINIIAVPAFLKARESANRTICLNHLKGLGNAIILYQNDFKGKCPATLEDLIKTQDVPAQSLICPSSGAKYVYRAADLAVHASPSMILAYDKLDSHKKKGRSVLFNDAHVEYMTEEKFQKAITLDNEIRQKMGLPQKPIQ